MRVAEGPDSESGPPDDLEGPSSELFSEAGALVAWERLRLDLIGLRDHVPAVLRQYPTPRPGYHRPPVQVSLAAGPEAVRVAAELHARHGDFVTLYVGALRYPLTGPQADQAARPDSGREPSGRAGLEAELDGPLTVASGETVTHALRLRSTGERPITVNTNGAITASIVDPATGAVVGGFAGAQHQPLVTWLVSPGQSVVIPLLVGTASRVAALGYAVPAGTWQLIAPLDLADGRRLVAGPLNLTIVDPPGPS